MSPLGVLTPASSPPSPTAQPDDRRHVSLAAGSASRPRRGPPSRRGGPAHGRPRVRQRRVRPTSRARGASRRCVAPRVGGSASRRSRRTRSLSQGGPGGFSFRRGGLSLCVRGDGEAPLARLRARREDAFARLLARLPVIADGSDLGRRAFAHPEPRPSRPGFRGDPLERAARRFARRVERLVLDDGVGFAQRRDVHGAQNHRVHGVAGFLSPPGCQRGGDEDVPRRHPGRRPRARPSASHAPRVTVPALSLTARTEPDRSTPTR